MDQSTLIGLLTVTSLLPGGVGWALNRRLDPKSDDDSLLALRVSSLQTISVISWLAVIVILVAGSSSTPYFVFLIPTVLGVLLTAWDNRRRLLAERWHFTAYAGFILRFVVGVSTPSLLLILTPLLVLASPRPLALGVLSALALLAGFRAFHRLLPWILGCHRWQSPVELAARFADIDRRSDAPAPRTLTIPVGTGKIFNAFALPHTRDPAVLFTSALLDSFPEHQIAGIYAHEVSHLEQFRRPRVRRSLEGLTLLLITAAALGVPSLAGLPKPAGSFSCFGPAWLFHCSCCAVAGPRDSNATRISGQ